MTRRLLASGMAVLILMGAGCQGTQDVFIKKQECAKYISSEKEWEQTGKTEGFARTFYDVCYSKKHDTCVSTRKTGNYWFQYDLLTGKNLHSQLIIESDGPINMKELNQKAIDTYIQDINCA